MTTIVEPLILSIETATRAGSVAVSRGSRLLSARTGDASRSHSTDLLELIREALDEALHPLREVELFAVALGPGSFTGLRIGIATVKSLASTLERRAVGVPTLYAVALAAGGPGRVVALLPAGRGELFAQSFNLGNSFEVVPLDSPTHVAPAALLESLRDISSIRWAGEGAQAQREMIHAVAAEQGFPFVEEGEEEEVAYAEGWVLAAPARNLAAHVGQLALEKYLNAETNKPEELHAMYVRLSDAELKDKCRT